MHYNLGKTLQDVENIVALPQQAAEAEDMLKDDTQLSEVPGLTRYLLYFVVTTPPIAESVCLKTGLLSAVASCTKRTLT